MAINRWRYVEYTDDGCALYECLQCYGRWEGRGEPGYIHHETRQYIACWHFCPLCGTQWLGKRTTDSERLCDKALGPRRLRIFEAQRQWESDAIDRYYKNGQRGPYPGVYTPPFYWQLEVRQTSNLFGGDIATKPWSVHNWIKGFSMRVPDVLAHARFLRNQLQESAGGRDIVSDLDGEPTQLEWTTQVRVTTSRDVPRNGYEIYRPLRDDQL